MRDAFHQASVADEYVRMVIDDRMSGPIELGSEQALGERHADAVRKPLAERTCRRFDAGRYPELGMAGRLRMELTKVTQLVERQIVARQMQQRVLQHRAVSVR